MISGSGPSSGTSGIESSAIWRLLHHNTRSILLTEPVRCGTQATSSQAAAPGQVEHALTRRTASGGTTVPSRCFISATHLPGRVEPLGICGTRAGEKMVATLWRVALVDRGADDPLSPFDLTRYACVGDAAETAARKLGEGDVAQARLALFSCQKKLPSRARSTAMLRLRVRLP